MSQPSRPIRVLTVDDHTLLREGLAVLIAATLALTEDAIKGQIRGVLAKLGANDRTHAVVVGLKPASSRVDGR